MKIFKICCKITALLAVALVPSLAFAVSQKEMEEARTIAAKAYIRYVNDGSGYLDEINPKTIKDLEAALKPKEKENIKAFLAIPVPTDYKDWNKEKLVEYWVGVFQDKSLQEKGRGGRLRARSQINKMTIAPPQAENTVTPSPATPVNPAASENGAPAMNPADSVPAVLSQDLNFQDEGEEEDINVEKVKSDTWVYIMVLAILVAIVIALVVYAANVFKKNGASNGNSHHKRHDSDEIEHYESVISDKEVEIAMLNKKLESALRQNSELKSRISSLEGELSGLRTSGRQSSSESEAPVAVPAAESVSAPKSQLRSIYLGRANSRGIFVRADRTLNPGHSIFVLNTSDGYSGSFKVADSPEVWDLALSSPAEYLETACTGHALSQTEGATRIVNESAGTAIFEGGCWRVIRKARIRYE